MKTKRISINSDIYFYYIIFNLHLYLYFWSSLRAATMERSVFLAWNLQGCFLFGIVWGQDRPMVCGRLPWNALDFWLETFWVVSCLVLFEASCVPWFAGSYHGTFWIFGLKPSGLFPIWYCLRPGTSHGLRAATMERPGFMFLHKYWTTFLILNDFFLDHSEHLYM